MKKIIHFSRAFVFTAILSTIMVVLGITGYFIKNGFNLGIDFQAGLIQEVQLAPRAFSLSYDGPGNAVISLNRTSLSVAVSGAGVQGTTYQYLIADYGTVGAFVQALSQIGGITVQSNVPNSTPFRYLVLDAQSNPVLGGAGSATEESAAPANLYWVHYLPQRTEGVSLEQMRASLQSLGDVNVQVLGNPDEQRFMIRLQESAMKTGIEPAKIGAILEKTFGEGEIAVTSSAFVGSRFSKDLTKQAGILLSLTLLIILVYASIRFKLQYAIGAVLAILHDGIAVVAFVVWTRMEFNTTTIAAILTILGYSINDTIVIFDRIRENLHIYPNEAFRTVLDRAITETLSRTFITTLTTMLAVLSLYIFTTGSMKDFALALLVGMVSGVYSTIYIASGFVFFWENTFVKKDKVTSVESRAEV
jgi:preprotein translocase subunit SecF